MEEMALPKLRVSRKEAKDKIQAQIEKGELLRGRKLCSEDELDKSGIEANNWSRYNWSYPASVESLGLVYQACDRCSFS